MPDTEIYSNGRPWCFLEIGNLMAVGNRPLLDGST